MQEPPGLKPDWLEEINSLSTKNSNIYKLNVQKPYYKLEAETLHGNFLKFVLLPFS